MWIRGSVTLIPLQIIGIGCKMYVKTSLVKDLIHSKGDSDIEDIVQLVNHLWGVSDRWEAGFGYHLTASFEELKSTPDKLKELCLDLSQEFVELDFGCLKDMHLSSKG